MAAAALALSPAQQLRGEARWAISIVALVAGFASNLAVIYLSYIFVTALALLPQSDRPLHRLLMLNVS